MGKTVTNSYYSEGEDMMSPPLSPPMSPPQGRTFTMPPLSPTVRTGPQRSPLAPNSLEELTRSNWKAGWKAAWVAAMQVEEARLLRSADTQSADAAQPPRSISIETEADGLQQALPTPMKVTPTFEAAQSVPRKRLSGSNLSNGKGKGEATRVTSSSGGAAAAVGSVLQMLANSTTPSHEVAPCIVPASQLPTADAKVLLSPAKSESKANVPPSSPTGPPPGLEYLVASISKAEPQTIPAVTDGLPSLGSALHGTGRCKPCVWFHKPESCQNGKDCQHCHLCPEGEIRARKKNARARKANPDVALLMTGTEGEVVLPTEEIDCRSAEEPEEIAPGFPEQEKFDILLPPGLSGFFERSISPSTASIVTENLSDGTQSGSWDAPLSAVTAAAEVGNAVAAASLTSVGSVLHGTGQCTPCAWFWKPQGCHNGSECRHCHSCPRGEIKSRRKLRGSGRPGQSDTPEEEQ
mmetsp:Transcript_43897/g.103836  ORF Transcript_43897/g.103836 Transcript_43897/m.103836 type:complete len:465 (-) Transcript_43897:96-1490(-)